MSNEYKDWERDNQLLKKYFGLRIETSYNDWVFGISLVHTSREYFLCLDLFKKSFHIGRLIKWD